MTKFNSPTGGKHSPSNGKFIEPISLASEVSNTMQAKKLSIDKNLRHVMDEKGLTILQVAGICKLPKSTIHNVLIGRQVSMKTVDKLCCGLNVSISFLAYGVDEQTATQKISPEDLLSGVFEVVIRKHIQK